jgi:DNA-binding transcriptional LysR family regulator
VAGSSLEVGVTYLENERLRGGRELPLYDEWYLLLTAGDGPSGAADELGWREAADERLCLLTPDMQNRRIVDGGLRGGGARPRPVVETNSISTLYAHVGAGVVGAVVADTWLHLYPVPAGMRGAAGAARRPPVDRACAGRRPRRAVADAGTDHDRP